MSRGLRTKEIGSHRHVFEYDGAFQCCDCGVRWGALPDKPVMPEKCVSKVDIAFDKVKFKKQTRCEHCGKTTLISGSG